MLSTQLHDCDLIGVGPATTESFDQLYGGNQLLTRYL